MYLRIGAVNLKNIVADTMNILRSGLDQAVGQRLHVLDLVFPRIVVFVIVITEYSCPGDTTVRDNLRKLCEYGLGVPRRALSIELIASKNNQVRFLLLDYGIEKCERHIVGVRARVDVRIATYALVDGEV